MTRKLYVPPPERTRIVEACEDCKWALGTPCSIETLYRCMNPAHSKWTGDVMVGVDVGQGRRIDPDCPLADAEDEKA